MPETFWWGDFYSRSFPRHLYRVTGFGYACVHVVPASRKEGQT